MKTIINGELVQIKRGLESVQDVEADLDFSMTAIEIIYLLDEEIKKHAELIKPSEDFIKIYQPRFTEIAEKYCKKDDKDKPIITRTNSGDSSYQFEQDQASLFTEAIKEMEQEKEIKPIVDARQVQVEKYNQLMERECKLKLPTFKKKWLPKKLTIAQLSPFYKLIED